MKNIIANQEEEKEKRRKEAMNDEVLSSENVFGQMGKQKNKKDNPTKHGKPPGRREKVELACEKTS